jgi:hypothetical protein
MFQWLGRVANTLDNGINRIGSYWGSPGETSFPTSEHNASRDEAMDPGEKLRSSMRIPLFLPYYDEQQSIGETQIMRLAYRRMLANPNIKAAMLGKIIAVMSLELKMLAHNKKDVRDKLISEFVEWNLTDRLNGGMPMFVWSILSGGLIDGYSVCEKVWELEKEGTWQNKEVLAELKPKDVNQDLVPEVDEFKNIVSIKGLRYNSGQLFNPQDFVIFTFFPLYGTPTGMSDFRASYKNFWFLDTIDKLRALGAEKRALPVIAGEYPDPTKEKSLQNALAAIKSSNWLAVPKDVKLQVLDIAGRSEEYFKSFRADLVEEIFLGIQGATLQALAGQSGVNVGRSTTHKDTSDLFKWVLSAFILGLLNNHKTGLIRDMVSRNFSGVVAYPKASFAGKDPEALKLELDIDKGVQSLGYTLSQEDVGERYARKLGVGDDALKTPEQRQAEQQQQQMGAMGGGMGGGMGGDQFGGANGAQEDPFFAADPAAKGNPDDGKFPEGDNENEFSEGWVELPNDLATKLAA